MAGGLPTVATEGPGAWRTHSSNSKNLQLSVGNPIGNLTWGFPVVLEVSAGALAEASAGALAKAFAGALAGALSPWSFPPPTLFHIIVHHHLTFQPKPDH